jgi:hypothetical protein
MSKTFLFAAKILLIAALILFNVFIATSSAYVVQLQLLGSGLSKPIAFVLSVIFATSIFVYILVYYRIHKFIFKGTEHER